MTDPKAGRATRTPARSDLVWAGAILIGAALACRSGADKSAPAGATSATPAASSEAVASAAPSATAKPKTIPKDYEGPLGLTWGQSPAEVRAALSKKFTFRREGMVGKMFSQTYAGAFAGQKAEEIDANFTDKKFIMLTAMYAAKDVRPASRRWRDLVDKTIETHGEPSKMAPIPEIPGLSGAASAYPNTPNAEKIRKLEAALDGMAEAAGDTGYGALDRKIAKGDWTPSAGWKFANGAVIVVTVLVGDPDASGARALHPTWMAAGPGIKEFADDAKGTSDL